MLMEMLVCILDGLTDSDIVSNLRNDCLTAELYFLFLTDEKSENR